MTEAPEFPPFPPWPEPAALGLVDVTDEPIDFTPVPRQRNRRNGWTELAQRAARRSQSRGSRRTPVFTHSSSTSTVTSLTLDGGLIPPKSTP